LWLRMGIEPKIQGHGVPLKGIAEMIKLYDHCIHRVLECR